MLCLLVEGKQGWHTFNVCCVTSDAVNIKHGGSSLEVGLGDGFCVHEIFISPSVDSCHLQEIQSET
jgi:hypothetical protein